mmetsp:Transcript_85850/g.188524  ORF Transcript_85850/g.188524 Transcript_85850/m.188524 type:complete len:100 (-) Transcript_85850:8-307(-)
MLSSIVMLVVVMMMPVVATMLCRAVLQDDRSGCSEAELMLQEAAGKNPKSKPAERRRHRTGVTTSNGGKFAITDGGAGLSPKWKLQCTTEGLTAKSQHA